MRIKYARFFGGDWGVVVGCGGENYEKQEG